MNHTLTIKIDKLRMWCGGGWRMYNYHNSKPNNYTLRFHYDQIFILSDTKLLESLNLNGKMKSIYKDDVIIFIFCDSLQQIRKIKFQILSNITECLHKLSLHIPVVKYNSEHGDNKPKYKNIEQDLKAALNNKAGVCGLPLPPYFIDFAKLCLLDPAFPQLVDETQKFLKEL